MYFKNQRLDTSYLTFGDNLPDSMEIVDSLNVITEDEYKHKLKVKSSFKKKTITISGFKSIAEAKKFADFYELSNNNVKISIKEVI